MSETVLERFLRYVQMDTQSDENANAFPSTDKQKNLGKLLTKELLDMGITDASFDEEFGYVYAHIPATEGKEEAPVIAFLAHMDTSPETSGCEVKPRVVENYQGGEIILNEEKKMIMSPQTYPSLLSYIGKDLVVTDGTTLLGADDKAGVAEIMSMAEYLLAHPEMPHGKIAIAFTPDEEIGAGVDHIDLDKLGADYAYTVDGGGLGELEYENFNAAGGQVTIHGVTVHPGEAKDKMVNASLVAMEFAGMLPSSERPEHAEGYEGFYHLQAMEGCVEEARLSYIIRDHDKDKFDQKKKLFLQTAEYLNQKYGEGCVEASVKDSYYNMKEKISPENMFLVNNAKDAMEELGITPIVTPIRGGTDGARLSFMGLPCPNICTGGHNFHGRFEYVCVQSMELIVKLLVRIVEKYPVTASSLKI